MLNTNQGGTIFMGVLDDGRIEGFALTPFQQDHIRLAIQDTFERYSPPVPIELYEVRFTPVIDYDAEKELKAIDDFIRLPNEQDATFSHLLQTPDYCWCDAHAMAQFSNGNLVPFFVVELHLKRPFQVN